MRHASSAAAAQSAASSSSDWRQQQPAQQRGPQAASDRRRRFSNNRRTVMRQQPALEDGEAQVLNPLARPASDGGQYSGVPAPDSGAAAASENGEITRRLQELMVPFPKDKEAFKANTLAAWALVRGRSAAELRKIVSDDLIANLESDCCVESGKPLRVDGPDSRRKMWDYDPDAHRNPPPPPESPEEWALCSSNDVEGRLNTDGATFNCSKTVWQQWLRFASSCHGSEKSHFEALLFGSEDYVSCTYADPETGAMIEIPSSSKHTCLYTCFNCALPSFLKIKLKELNADKMNVTLLCPHCSNN